MRLPTPEEYSHERLGDEFARVVSEYDTRRRMETLIDEFLADDMVRGRAALDVGCGLGFFSERLKQRGALVTACDLGPGLVARTRNRVGCNAVVADALHLTAAFGHDRFELVVSSECIEHTPDPAQALREMVRVLKPGGVLAVSTPNLVWRPVVRAASRLKLRSFDGHENFISWPRIRRILQEAGVEIIREKGLHLFPFQLHLDALSTWCDRHIQAARGIMINICILGRKRVGA